MKFFNRKQLINIEVIIDDIFRLIPTKESFKIEPLLTKVLEDRKLFEGENLWFVAGVDKVENILLTADLIQKQGDSDFILTEKGILAKEIGGLTSYRKYRQQQIGFNTHQRKVNIWLIAATILAALSPIIVEFVKNYFPPAKTSSEKVIIKEIKIDSIKSQSINLKQDTQVLHKQEQLIQKQ